MVFPITVRLCAFAICIGTVACSNRIQNSFTILGCEDKQNKPVDASGITRCGDFYIVSERCPAMQRYDASANAFFSIPLPGLHQSARLMGVAAFNHMLYAIDNVNHVVYRIDTAGSVRATLSIPMPQSSMTRQSIDGIAINRLHRLIYIVQRHRTLLKFARIHTFRTEFDNEGNIDSLLAMPENEVNIGRAFRQILSKKRFRYTDITYDEQLMRLVLLRTRKRKRVIDEIEVNQLGGALVPASLREVADVTREVHSCTGYSTKLNALTADSSNYYLVSKNTGDTACEADKKHQTLFIRIFVQEGPIFLKKNPLTTPEERR
jgi:hypothetical protein